jgi:nucleoside-diphosphate-sugar epimerase
MSQWLITGATGFIGQVLVKEWLRSVGRPEQALILLVRNRSKLEHVFVKQGLDLRDPRVQVVEGDLHQTENLRPWVSKLHGVVHLAGCVSAHARETFDRVNFEGTYRLHQLLKQQTALGQIKWIQVSSIAANGPVHLVDSERDPSRDQDHPISWYGRSKFKADAYLRSHHPSHQRVIVRPPVVFGEVDRAWIPFMKILLKGWMPVWKGRVIPYFSMIDERTLVKVLLALMARGQPHSQTLYPTLNEPVHWNQLMRVWKDLLLGPKRSIRSFPVYPVCLKPLEIVLSVASRFKAMGEGLPLTSDKVREMRHSHWVKDGGRQVEALGVGVPAQAGDEWKRCIEAWRSQGVI